ncbi:MAG: hypothetical protein WKF84_08765 [Pyrinomonadaceae bacterium]
MMRSPASNADHSGQCVTDGEIAQLAPSEHLRRASIYLTNRACEDARRHWQALDCALPE